MGDSEVFDGIPPHRASESLSFMFDSTFLIYMTIAILALQGAFAEHEAVFRSLGAETFFIRNRADWDREKDALVIPGGESTAMTRIMRDLDLWGPISEALRNGLPAVSYTHLTLPTILLV